MFSQPVYCGICCCETHIMTKSEIATMAERVCKARDRDPRDAKAMLRQIDLDHGHRVVRAVVAKMQRQGQLRYAEAMAVFEGLSNDTTFADALAIKTAGGDLRAQGWTKQSDGTYAKMVVKFPDKHARSET